MCHEQGTYTSHEDGREKLWIVVAEMNMIIDDVVTSPTKLESTSPNEQCVVSTSPVP